MRFVYFLAYCLLLLVTSQAKAVLLTLNQSELVAGGQLEILVETSGSQATAPVIKLPASWQTHFKLIDQIHQVEARPRGDYVHRWSLVLQHQQAASISRRLQLAPLQINGKKSQPLQLRIKAARKKIPQTKQRLTQPLVMQQQVDFTDAYIGQTLVYELLIRYQGFPVEPRLSPLEVKGATARQLGEGQEQGFNHQGVKVQEARWQELLQLHETEVVIAPRFFSSRLIFTGQTTGQLYETQTPELTLNVRPVPDSWPAEQPWLPALGVKLEAAFLSSPEQVKQGEVLELIIHLAVVGQQARNLPQFKTLVSEHWRIEPLTEELTDRIVDGLLVGQLKQRLLFYPKKAGNLKLPDLTLNWWDVTQHKAAKSQVKLGQLAVLPDKKFQEQMYQNKNQTISQPAKNKIALQPVSDWLGWLLLISTSLSVLFICFRWLKKQPESLELPPLNPP